MKKTLTILLSLALLLALGACKPGSPTPAAGSDPAELDFVELSWIYIGPGVTNDAAVMTKVNEYLKEKLNCSLRMVWDTWDLDKAMPAINTSDNTIDIIFTSSWTPNEYAAMAKKGAFVRLDDPNSNLIEQHAKGMWDAIPKALADSAKVKGAAGEGIYAVPSEKEVAQQYVWGLNMDILTKYGYTADDITDFYSLGPIFEKIKAGEGADFYPLNTDFAVLQRAVRSVDMVDGHNLLSYPFDPTSPSKSGNKVESAFEAESMQKYLNQMREYYLAGYINPAATSNSTDMGNTWNANREEGKYAVEVYPYYPGFEYSFKTHTAAIKPVQAAISSTTSSRGAMNAIHSASKNKERAMMLLNLVNTDATLRTLLTYGVDGTHYNKLSDGKIQMVADNGYAPWAAGLGKITLLPLQEGQPDNLYTELFPNFNNSAENVPIIGWSFDQKPVETQMAALVNVQAQYAIPLITGAVDPATELPKFINELKANGIDDVLTEANQQIEAFLNE